MLCVPQDSGWFTNSNLPVTHSLLLIQVQTWTNVHFSRYNERLSSVSVVPFFCFFIFKKNKGKILGKTKCWVWVELGLDLFIYLYIYINLDFKIGHGEIDKCHVKFI